jgi:hypothetical protein
MAGCQRLLNGNGPKLIICIKDKMRMKSTAEIGLKIPARTREYYRYTGISAELERHGAGSSRHELAWAVGTTQPREKAVAESKTGDQISPAIQS